MSQFTAISSRPPAAATAAKAPSKPALSPTAATQSIPEIEQAFSDQPELKKRVYSAIGESPQHQPLFSSISSYILQLRQTPSATNGTAADEPAAKKRKLDGPDSQKTAAGAPGAWASSFSGADFTLPDVSFAIPQRKKLNLQLVGAGSAGDSSGGGIRACSGGGANVEFGIGFRDIEQIFCLPIPEKAKKQWHFIVIPKNNDGVNAVPEGTTVPEQMVWTFQEPTNKELEAGAEASPNIMAERLDTFLAPFGKKVVFPTKEEFQSTIPQSHRKGEPGFHVKAFRGSKEGFLFFTSVGIVFGFKKPLVYFSFGSVESISYTSVLQRTFNLNITTNPSGPEEKSQEIEFSMIDQADYTGIDQYIKEHGLNDASMAAQRKAQMYNVNGPGEGKGEGGETAADDGETELEKAARMLEDEEDEDEEDYDPGSEGESEGEGTSSEDEDDDDEEEGEEDEEGNIVQDELGSEAEDVQVTDEE
ncbi:protein of unknown function DUF1747 eukaryote [Macrophomina phaseolina MS6]|uniref:Histone chaperone RTT106/FACT complex subunit SPT16-like middle domain-containing protein n=1 Tax=Macrophomina phaseolina (strain MS6) TaxID=1126212 RepID=K2QLS5_MACPH|nr:protein of unknown function DUF1747 eukaryote [Macrophomina phaseolina MS6]